MTELHMPSCNHCGSTNTTHNYGKIVCLSCGNCNRCDCCPCNVIGCVNCPNGGRRKDETEEDYFERYTFIDRSEV